MTTFNEIKDRTEDRVKYLRKSTDHFSPTGFCNYFLNINRDISKDTMNICFDIIKSHKDYFHNDFEVSIKNLLSKYKNDKLSTNKITNNFIADFIEIIGDIKHLELKDKNYEPTKYLFAHFVYLSIHITWNNFSYETRELCYYFRFNQSNSLYYSYFGFEHKELKNTLLDEKEKDFKEFLLENKEYLPTSFIKSIDRILKQNSNTSIEVIKDAFTSQIFNVSLEDISKPNERKKYLKDTISKIETKNKSMENQFISFVYILSDIYTNKTELDDISLNFLTTKIFNLLVTNKVSMYNFKVVLENTENISTPLNEVLSHYFIQYITEETLNAKGSEAAILNLYFILKGHKSDFLNLVVNEIRKGISKNLSNSMYYSFNIDVDYNDPIIIDLGNRYIKTNMDQFTEYITTGKIL